MNIVFVITGLGMGGAETQVCSLADAMANKGFKVSIIYLGGEKVVSPVNSNINVISIGLKKSIFTLFKAILTLRKRIKEISPDVVHTHMVHANLLVRIVRPFTKIPVLITSAHNSNEGGVLRMLLYRVTHFLSDVTTNVGSLSVERFTSIGAVPKGGMISMVNGIDTNKFTPSLKSQLVDELCLDYHTKIFVVVGRNEPQKDYKNLLDAISLVDSDIDFKVLVIGKDTEELAEYSKSIGIEGEIELLGLRKDVDEIMSNSHCLIMSSAWEGLPIVIGEAMASGCSIITTDAGGCREWLKDDDVVAPIKNSKALARLIEIELHKNVNDHVKDIEQNRKHVEENFSIESITNRWIEIYKNPKSAYEK
ncbi:glycosyltransferase [Vibrio cyclitrophicus]|uniref:glycosyltransferase n=1 Tax=Vibrio cyclitrophicus TaxID=47951 RepID=UPI0011B64956|nr:glycosyltransferase [Vibrio cyclitrophicus]